MVEIHVFDGNVAFHQLTQLQNLLAEHTEFAVVLVIIVIDGVLAEVLRPIHALTTIIEFILLKLT
jgi:hypothetical protein